MEKSALTSKKFLAYLLAQLCWTGLLVLAILKATAGFWTTPLIAMVVTQGFLQVSYVLGQAYVDKYVRVAQLWAINGGAKPDDA